jgi:K+-transporting ATPase ATPase A chain
VTINSILQISIYFALILALTKPLGLYMSAVYSGRRIKFISVLRPLEVFCYKIAGIDEQEEHDWKRYSFNLLAFSFIGCLISYILLRLQGQLPLNPRGFGGAEMTPDLAFNTAISFTTNTNWQSYSPESTISYFSNMVSLAIHNWMSAAAGMAVAIAVIRGFCRRETKLIGNFWVDLTRSTVYLLLPIAFIAALLFISTGVPQNFNSYTEVTTVEGAKQLIAQGPVASQEAIKQLGTNGGGFFNANSSHPFENPSPASNLLSLILVFAIPAAFTFVFGEMAGNRRQGWAIFSAMGVLFLLGSFTCLYFEQQGTPHLDGIGINQAAEAGDAGGNMEGKETRFGIAESALFAAVTTGASCGAVNSMHDSYTPIGGLVPLFNILTGEVVFGGVGAGMYGILMLAILAVFIAGLMVGRTPEFLGKKIERFEVQMAMLATLVLAASILVFSKHLEQSRILYNLSRCSD